MRRFGQHPLTRYLIVRIYGLSYILDGLTTFRESKLEPTGNRKQGP
jgi:hypothetical protein